MRTRSALIHSSAAEAASVTRSKSTSGCLRRFSVLSTCVALAGIFHCVQAVAANQNGGGSSCEQVIPAITSGYGANGSYAVDIQSVDNPGFKRKPVQVFLPRGAEGKRPVIFFSHGYGPGEWKSYSDLITHWVSVGYVVVFSSYPAIFADTDERYDALWKGFEAAADKFGSSMDLSRVGFAGHSYGGGATPAMAYHGLVGKGWGRQGAFLAELAPWYSYEITAAQWQQFPGNVQQFVEVYDKDEINDHRMGIDIYKSSHISAQYFFLVHSASINGCEVTADHSAPARSPSLRIKQYGVFRPLDALADIAFNGSSAAREALTTMGQSKSNGGYQPLSAESEPSPVQPESYYKFAWSNSKNPRLQH